MLHGLENLGFVMADSGGLGVGPGFSRAFTLQRHLQDFGKVQGVTGRALGDLFATTETVGDDQPVGWCAAHGGEKFELADGDGQVVPVVVPIALEAERAGHATASWSGAVEIDAEAVQDSLFGGHFHE